ncbi:uncharacterized protein ARMOST_21098 [Armillaria ostoyae]|uniref:Uncharacterized protein n=1 Tax=Armillaria ostoyae TaxID=47428 RepID=A0A284S9A9_ARMOS|nr:uncharacterized protein ARMOST_21098 [Armillaria ostoyae]
MPTVHYDPGLRTCKSPPTLKAIESTSLSPPSPGPALSISFRTADTHLPLITSSRPDVIQPNQSAALLFGNRASFFPDVGYLAETNNYYHYHYQHGIA